MKEEEKSWILFIARKIGMYLLERVLIPVPSSRSSHLHNAQHGYNGIQDISSCFYKLTECNDDQYAENFKIVFYLKPTSTEELI